MKRLELEHVLRAAASISQETSFVVIGSQALLLSVPDPPADWMRYSQLHYIGELTVVCPDLHDLAVSKCVAGRDKDAAWISGLLKHRLIELPRLLERIAQLDASSHPVDALTAWAHRRAAEASTP